MWLFIIYLVILSPMWAKLNWENSIRNWQHFIVSSEYQRIVDLFFIYLRVVSEMNIEIPFCNVYWYTMKLETQALNEFWNIWYYHKSEVTTTNPPTYLKYDSPMKILICLSRMNTMTSVILVTSINIMYGVDDWFLVTYIEHKGY